MDNQWISNEEQSELTGLINSYTSVLRKIIGDINNTTIGHYNKVLLNYVERSLYNIEGIGLILPSFYKSYHYHYPVQILIRAVITDSVAIVYLVSYLKPDSIIRVNDLEFREKCNSLDYDFMKAVFDIINNGMSTPNQKEEIKRKASEHFGSQFPTFFKEEKGEIKLNSRKDAGVTDISIKDMFKRIEEEFKRIDEINKKNKEAQGEKYEDSERMEAYFKEAYFIFKYNSQFEHGSRITNYFVEFNNRLNFKNIIEALRYSVFSFAHVEKLLNRDPKHKEMMDSLAIEIAKFKHKFLSDSNL